MKASGAARCEQQPGCGFLPHCKVLTDTSRFLSCLTTVEEASMSLPSMLVLVLILEDGTLTQTRHKREQVNIVSQGSEHKTVKGAEQAKGENWKKSEHPHHNQPGPHRSNQITEQARFSIMQLPRNALTTDGKFPCNKFKTKSLVKR